MPQSRVPRATRANHRIEPAANLAAAGNHMQRIPEPELMNEFEQARLATCGLDRHLPVAGRLPG